MTCRELAVELVECARTGQLAGAELQTHLMACPRCHERWEDERRLSAYFRIMRDAVTRQPSVAERERLMREFEHAHAGGFHAIWRWALNAAAILLVVVALVYDWNHRRVPAGNASRPENPASLQADSGAGEESGFVDVPYALPLAPGEFVRVIRTELDPVALAGMGVDFEATDGAEIAADVLLGEDGVPRAVRVLPETGFLNVE